MSSGYLRFINTAQSRTLNFMFGPEVFGSHIRRQASGFYGTRPSNNPIWHSHSEGTRACNADVKATDLTHQACLWAGPPRPSITHCDWLIMISNFPVLCTLSLALQRTAAMWELRTSISLSRPSWSRQMFSQDHKNAIDILSPSLCWDNMLIALLTKILLQEA